MTGNEPTSYERALPIGNITLVQSCHFVVAVAMLIKTGNRNRSNEQQHDALRTSGHRDCDRKVSGCSRQS
jgi:hypothetical protein